MHHCDWLEVWIIFIIGLATAHTFIAASLLHVSSGISQEDYTCAWKSPLISSRLHLGTNHKYRRPTQLFGVVYLLHIQWGRLPIYNMLLDSTSLCVFVCLDFDLVLLRPGRDDIVLNPSRVIADYKVARNVSPFNITIINWSISIIIMCPFIFLYFPLELTSEIRNSHSCSPVYVSLKTLGSDKNYHHSRVGTTYFSCCIGFPYLTQAMFHYQSHSI